MVDIDPGSFMTSEQYELGMNLLGVIWNLEGNMVAESLRALEELAPAPSTSVVEFVYGDIYSLEGLDVRLRPLRHWQ